MNGKKAIFIGSRIASTAISIMLSSVLIDPFQYAQKGAAKRPVKNRFQNINKRK